MNRSKDNPSARITTIDLGVTRPHIARILIAQANWPVTQWRHDNGLTFHANIDNAQSYVKRILSEARQATVDMVLFPELSVPEESLPFIQSWSDQTGSIVVAGSHYSKTKRGFVSRCPVAIAGQMYFTDKLTPAPMEISPIAGEGLSGGDNINCFHNSSIGNFAVLICSDYLDLEIKSLIPIRDLDLLCVPAFQRDSYMYHVRMNLDCEESEHGLYIAYANTLAADFGDGRSAFFGLMDRLFLAKLEQAGYTNGVPSLKICELNREQRYLVLEIDLQSKKPFAKRTVHTKPNIQLIHVAGAVDVAAERFTNAIGHHDDRYRRIKELFVAPSEYGSLLDILEHSKLLFITGDPGIGKTYTAVRLLRHYFEQGYEPIWYAGIEKSERLNQRQILENFTPRNRNSNYFEVAFGRTVFEERDTIFRIFGPLLDHLKGIDARVVITSRREVFEQFAQETLSFLELKAFTEEMNVVKPSYSATSLAKILHILAENAKWYQDAANRDLVLKEIANGNLATPLAIRDFAFSTEGVESQSLLMERLVRRVVEEKELFTEEIEACDFHTKLALALIFFFGSQSLATLAGWFNQIASFLDPKQHWTGTAPFFEEVRVQSGYRIEQYGSKASVLRFIHPYYEEAFVATVERDSVTYDLISSVVQFATRVNAHTAYSAVSRYWIKYPAFTKMLLADMVPVLRASGKLEDIYRFGLKLLGIHIFSRDVQHIELLQRLCTIDELIGQINKASDLHIITQGLRFLHNYVRRTERDAWNLRSGQLDFGALALKWRAETSFSKVLANWEWSYRFDQRTIVQFLAKLDDSALLIKFGELNPIEQTLFISVAGNRADVLDLRQRVGHVYSRHAKVQQWMSAELRTNCGIVIDEGAETALRKGFHLLPVGIVSVIGHFDREDVIPVFNTTGGCIGGGVALYGAPDIQHIKGKHSFLIGEILGHYEGQSILHNKRFLLMEED
jgi:predicted amidohydrolase